MLGRQYAARKGRDLFYRDARFYSVEEVSCELQRVGFRSPVSSQTIFGSAGSMSNEQPAYLPQQRDERPKQQSRIHEYAPQKPSMAAMNIGVAPSTESYQVFFVVLTATASELHMMNLETAACATRLASPAVALQHSSV